MTNRDRLKIEDCYTDLKSYWDGTQKVLSSGQVLSKKDVGSPRVIEVNDIVYVEVISAVFRFRRRAKALEAGGVGELISVEVLPQKKRLFGQVMDQGKYRSPIRAVS